MRQGPGERSAQGIEGVAAPEVGVCVGVGEGVGEGEVKGEGEG